MIKVVTAQRMREIEAAADASGISYSEMMERAGRAVADRIREITKALKEPRITFLIGPGNNGGDGLVAGRLVAAESSAQVRFYLLKKRSKSDPNFEAAHNAGLFITYAEDDRDHRVIRNLIASADVIVDAMFGIGVRLPLKGDAEKVLRSANQALRQAPPFRPVSSTLDPSKTGHMKTAPTPYVIAVDCPSGLDCDTGQLDTNTIHADETVTFIAAKPGLFSFPGAAAVGRLLIASLDIPEDLKALAEEKWEVADSAYVRSLLPPRPPNSHKGTYGKVMIAAGSINYTGAPALAAESAYRSGAGLVTVAAPQPVINIVAAQLTEPTWLLLPHDMGVISEQAAKILLEGLVGYKSLLLGPGWGQEETTRGFLARLLPGSHRDAHERRSIGFLIEQASTGDKVDTEERVLPPLVIDADGLNLLSKLEKWWERLPQNTILTPHPAEMARLSGLEISEILRNRWTLVVEKAAEWKAVLVLKGAHTLVASPEGRVHVLPFKTDALATAGTGDVLAGIIAGLLAQGIHPYEAAVAGTYIHGMAGQEAAGWQNSRSIIARDIIDALSQAFDLLEADQISAL